MRGGDHPGVQFAAWNVTEEYCENIYIKVLLMVHFVFLSNSIAPVSPPLLCSTFLTSLLNMF